MLALQRASVLSSNSHLFLRSAILRLQEPLPCVEFARRTMSSKITPEQFQALKKYTACDISDALVKLKVPNSGFLPDLNLYSRSLASADSQITIAPASTLLLVPKNATDVSAYPAANIPGGKHWVDLTQPQTIVVISQPKGQICAALGGIMALRMKMLKAEGVISYGRVRDVEELQETGLPVRASLFNFDASNSYPNSSPHYSQCVSRSGRKAQGSRGPAPRQSHTQSKCLWILMGPS
jgi:regulator of RNase E activity RraA